MDFNDFSMGVLVTLIGVGTTVILTKHIEKRKLQLEAEHKLNILYIELSDLAEECQNDIRLMCNNYKTIKKLKLTTSMGDQVERMNFPSPPTVLLLEKSIESCFTLLTKDQRKALRKLLYMLNLVSEMIERIRDDVCKIKFSELDDARVYYCLSSLCAIYHLTTNLSEQKERFVTITKTPQETFTSVLEGLNLKITTTAILQHKHSI